MKLYSTLVISAAATHLAKLGEADKAEDAVPAEQRHRAQVRVAPGAVGQVGGRQQQPANIRADLLFIFEMYNEVAT